MVISTFSGAGRENRTLISSLENLHTNHCTIPAYTELLMLISEPKFRRLVASRLEALLSIEREAKTAKIRNFGQKYGVGYRDRTVREARDDSF